MLQTNAPFVSIVLLNWNGYYDTVRCIESLKQINYSNFNIVLVDNDSEESETRKLENIWPGKVLYFQSKENLGFAGGNNLGLTKAALHNPDYYLLLNNDTIVDPSFLNNLVKAAQEHQKYGILCPLIYRLSPPDEIWYSGGTFSRILGFPLHTTNSVPGDTQDLIETDYATGCCCLISKSALLDLKGFDEDFFVYCEDTDLTMRAKKAGWSIGVIPSAKIWHKVHGSTGAISTKINTYYVNRNRLLLLNKHYKIGSRKIFHMIVYMAAFLLKLTKLLVCFEISLASYLWRGVKDGLYKTTGKSKIKFT